MPSDPRIDAYIANAAPFARPILEHLRETVHAVCPNVVETMKWSMPAFDHNGPMASMAAFKEHCTFGFWKAPLITDPETGAPLERSDTMGHFGRVTSLKDLPSKTTLKDYIRQAVKLNEAGVKAMPAKRSARKALAMPGDFERALKRDRKALTGFEALPPSHQRDYIEWITEAKREETREKRIATALEWLAEGKSRNWKYERKSS